MSEISPGVLSPPRESTGMAKFASTRCLNVWHSRIDVDQVTKYRDALQPKNAVRRRRKIRPDHPVIVRREVLRRYYFGDFARKVVGVGSVGTEAFVLLLMGDRDDEFLGWTRGGGATGAATKNYYVRQLRDKKGSMDVPAMDGDQLTYYAELCGWALARGHARTGRATLISGYLGSGGEFDKAIAQFSAAYAEQNDNDFPALVDAVAAGRVQAVMGLLTANPRPRLTGPLLPAEGAQRRVKDLGPVGIGEAAVAGRHRGQRGRNAIDT
jgi:hypothetical protein